MAQNPDQNIIIIGGGIGGLSASIALQDAGYETHVYEAEPSFDALGVSVSINPNGIKGLRALGHGIAAGVESAGRALKNNSALRVRDPEGNLVAEPSNDDTKAKYGDPIWIIRRRVLHELLIAAEKPGSLHSGKRLVDVKQDDESVTAFFDDGTSATGDILIGADGLNSVTRKVLLGTEAPRYTGWGNIRGLISKTMQMPEGHEDGIVVMGGKDHVLIFPLGGGAYYVSCAFEVPVGTWPRDAKEAQAEVIKRSEGWFFVNDAVKLIDDDTLIAREIRDHVPVDHWTVGRATLLGDAAHAMGNFWGQGANTTIEDAVVLGRCFAGALDGRSALQAYERARLNRTSVLQVASARVDGHVRDNEAFVAWQFDYDAAIADLEPQETSYDELLAALA